MILANEKYTAIVQTLDLVQLETTVTIQEVKHTAQIIKRNEDDKYRLVIFKGDKPKSNTKTVVVFATDHYSKALETLDNLANIASRGESLKPFTVLKTRKGRERLVTFANMKEALDYFSYTLECGASWYGHRGCKKVNRTPTTPKALMTALANSVRNTQGSCYDPDRYKLV